MAKRIVWTAQAKADIRDIEQSLEPLEPQRIRALGLNRGK